MPIPQANPRRFSAVRSGAALLALAAFGIAGCAPGSAAGEYPAADLRPPDLLAAGPTSSREVLLRFDEAVTSVIGSFSVQPGSSLSPRVEGNTLVVGFDSAQSPGADYSLVGEVEDLHGNRTRFLVRFTGWNDRAPPLRLSELSPCKNSSKTKPHRDYVELEVLADGNLGGEELSWASSVKTASYRFPGVEVKKGDFVVLHLAPEGLPEERDELGADTTASGGIDATATGRDFWCGSMALPDSSGAVALALRPGSPPMDGLFYADDSKTGALGEGKLADLVSSLARSGAWALAGASPAWEDGVPWSGSSSRSICRSLSGSGSGSGRAAWYVSASGGQSPGAGNGAAAGKVAPAASVVPQATAAHAADASTVVAEPDTETAQPKAAKPKAVKAKAEKTKGNKKKRSSKKKAEPDSSTTEIP
jgi:hypothetical protein